MEDDEIGTKKMKKETGAIFVAAIGVVVVFIAGVFQSKVLLYIALGLFILTLLYIAILYILLISDDKRKSYVRIPKNIVTSGQFIVNATDPTKETYRLVLDDESIFLAGKKLIVLDVIHESSY